MQTGITINGVTLTAAELDGFCWQALSHARLPAWEKDMYAFILQWSGPEAYIEVQTSGSTGAPKNIRLQKSWMEYSARQTCRFFGLNEQSTALLCLPAVYIAGKMMIVRAMVAGFNLLVHEPTGQPFTGLEQQIDFAAVTPFQLFQSLEFLRQNPVVKTLIVGGGNISNTLEAKVQELPAEIYSTYGMTETSSHIALRRVNGNQRQDHFIVLGQTRITIDSRGCLMIENPQLFNGQLITNDLVELLAENRFRWLGRYDNIINTGGVKVIPEEVEQKLSKLSSRPMVITSRPDEKLGEKVLLVLEGDELTVEEKQHILSEARAILPRYSVPGKVICVKALPKTPGGKTDRRVLKQIVAESIYE